MPVLAVMAVTLRDGHGPQYGRPGWIAYRYRLKLEGS
jgi:hypothetical protein